MIRKIHNISKSTQLNPSQHYIPNFILIKLSHKYFKAFVSPKILCLNRSLTPKIPKFKKNIEPRKRPHQKLSLKLQGKEKTRERGRGWQMKENT